MINSRNNRLNRIIAGIVFLISFLVYYDTMAPTVSFWDCGEFIATAHTLGVPHPPGSPLFLIIGRVFSMIPFSPDIAFRVNLISVFVSALAVMLLYLIIVKIIAHWRGGIKENSDVIIAFGGALVGALTFAFTDSHWFNAVEAEVYSMSTFFTAIVVWLILHWSERAEEQGNERYILIIAYMIGLAIGIHLLNLLALPFIALIIYFRKQSFEWKSFLITIGITGVTFVIIHNGVIKGLPKLASEIGVFGVVVAVLIVFGIMIWSIVNKQQLLSIVFTSMVLILIGYSSYTIIFIRSGQDPVIDENDPETVTAAVSYMEREQYGQVGRFPRRYKGIPAQHEVVGAPANGQKYSVSQKRKYMFYNVSKQWDFFWNYQVKKMYWRYFLWQFAGRGNSTEPGVTAFGANNRQDGVNWSQFGLPLAFILGLAGMIYHFYRDEKEAFSMMTLFFLTGLAIIIYLNQDNPQPRERDYSYVGSFLAFSVWIGVGAAAIVENIIKKIKTENIGHRLGIAVILLQVVLIPFAMVRANYHEHDRSGNYVAWDMSYNMLQSCEPHGIIFTNGDNDTFPLWYLQEVEGMRKDVTVANLSLLNTPWYIRQLRDSRPKGEGFINLTDDQILGLTSGLTPWKTQKIQIAVEGDPQNADGYIEWVLKPTFANQALKVQDMMILRIINDAKWKYPIYFAVTVSPTNKIGLDKYLDMEGLTFRLRSHKVDAINPGKMQDYLMTELGDSTWSTNFSQSSLLQVDSGQNKSFWSKDYQPGYLFRNLGNENVHYNPQIIRLLQNYRSAYMQLAVHYFFDYQKLNRKEDADPEEVEMLRLRVKETLDQMEKNLPERTIAIESKDLYFQIGQIYSEIGEKVRLRHILDNLESRRNLSVQDRIRYGQTYIQDLEDYEKAKRIFKDLYDSYLEIENAVKSSGLKRTGINQKTWNEWQKNYGDIVSTLVLTYQEMNMKSEAELVLTSWLERNPGDINAKKMLEDVQK
ncbi:uncharacterized protein METZ01_LOCUS15556 [marine metagenome]|uniref:DUF2723 domain-containing protein n=1 Tax=marine metagenome TaxID=408172 RepID=A0A381P6Y5_9ZZZZ